MVCDMIQPRVVNARESPLEPALSWVLGRTPRRSRAEAESPFSAA